MSDEIVDAARAALASGQDIVISEIIETEGSTPRHRGARMLMTADGDKHGTVGGGRIEQEAHRISRETFATKRDSGVYDIGISASISGETDDSCGTARILIRYYSHEHPEAFQDDPRTKPMAYIFGCGHVGQAVERALRFVEFDTVAVDDRPGFATREHFPDAQRCITVSSLDSVFDEVEVAPDAYLFLMSYSQEKNCEIMRQALARDVAYVGLLGSKRKIRTIFDRLAAAGVDAEADPRVFAPIGDDISAETPAEIAISVAAQIVRVRAAKATSAA